MFLDGVTLDLRQGIRGWRRRPGLALTIAGILALAMGTLTTMYSLLDWAVLRPLPYPDSQRIYCIGFPKEGTADARPRASVVDFERLHAAHNLFDRLAVSRWDSYTLRTHDETERVDGDAVSSDFFVLLGGRAVAGRLFGTHDFSLSEARAVIISHSLWERRFGGDRAAIGSRILLNREPYVIAGVAAANFHDPEEYRRHVPIDVWIPLIRQLEKNPDARVSYVTGHLVGGISADRAQAQLSTIQFESAPQAAPAAKLLQLHDLLTGANRYELFVLTLAVALVLLIATANVAGLLLARGAAMGESIAMRIALGASRRRLMQQQVIEVLPLVAFAGAAALPVAALLLHLARGSIPAELSRAAQAYLDGRVMAFVLGLSLFTTFACSLWPAIRNSAQPRRSAKKIWTHAGAAAVVFQLALSLTLLVGTGVLIKSFRLLISVNPGFAAGQILTMQLRLPLSKYRQAQQRSALYTEALRRLSTMHGVESAAFVTSLPLGGSGFLEQFVAADHPIATDEQRPSADWNLVSPGYFSTFGISLLAGRLPTAHDLARSAGLVLVNRALAQQYWPHGDAVGKRIRFGPVHEDGTWQQIIGVVGDVKHSGLESVEEPQIYELYPVLPPPYGYLVLRTQGAPLAAAHAARELIHDLDPDVSVDKVASMSDVVAGSVAPPRFRMVLLAGFSFLALLLALLGVYGAIGFSVSRRTREIGIRMAIGASARATFGAILMSAAKLLILGSGLGLLGAAVFTRALRAFLFGVQPLDGPVWAAACIVLMCAGLLAALLPAGRAASIDPAIALRHE